MSVPGPACRTFPTTPIIVIPSRESYGQKIVLPIGFWPGNDVWTTASLTMAIRGRTDVTQSPKSRPLLSGIPSAANVPGDTTERTTPADLVQSIGVGR